MLLIGYKSDCSDHNFKIEQTRFSECKIWFSQFPICLGEIQICDESKAYQGKINTIILLIKK